jgi:nucleotide-binding universal stress UspA family protein
MYQKILVALENSPADQSLLPHIAQLAHILHSHLLLIHVAEGWAARHFAELALKESEEMVKDRRYLEETASALQKQGLAVSTYLARGEPSQEILNTAEKEQCDLIAMTSHGHRFLADLFLGSTIEEVRHRSTIPILVVKLPSKQISLISQSSGQITDDLL